MLLLIDNKSGLPIYDQLYTQIKNLIMTGELSEDEMLPSIRNLAKDLRISVITTKRAYDELEKEGFIYTVPAKGCFVAHKNTELIKEQKLREIEDHISKIADLSSICGVDKKEIIEMINIYFEKEV